MHKNNWPDDAKTRWPNFSAEEVECKCGCGEVPEPVFMDQLQYFRSALRFPLPVTSGFRCEEYDKSIGGAGVHPSGLAADIAVGRAEAYRLVNIAIDIVTGIGVKGRGASRFVHLDMLPLGEDQSHPRPRLWTYNG